MKAIVAERGQVTIPKALRDRLGIEPGTVLEFSEEGGRLVASKRIESPVEARDRGFYREYFTGLKVIDASI